MTLTSSMTSASLLRVSSGRPWKVGTLQREKDFDTLFCFFSLSHTFVVLFIIGSVSPLCFGCMFLDKTQALSNKCYVIVVVTCHHKLTTALDQARQFQSN